MTASQASSPHERAALRVRGTELPGSAEVLTPGALAFVADLAATFGARREALLERRRDVQARLDAGERFDFLPETRDVRVADWKVAPVPADLLDRRVEIT